jgi:hypothetical protein
VKSESKARRDGAGKLEFVRHAHYNGDSVCDTSETLVYLLDAKEGPMVPVAYCGECDQYVSTSVR